MTEGSRSTTRIVRISLVTAASALVAHAALAQGQKQPGTMHAKPHAMTHPAPKQAAASDAGAHGPVTVTAVTTAPSAPTRPAGPNDAGAVEARTLEGGVHVFKFTELDIEGRLRSPQLVYFLRRVRAEFAAGDLGHRSFLREMSETRMESTF
jgi:hypothetical protein